MKTDRQQRRFKFILLIGIGLRLLVFAYQDPFNNDNHIEIVEYVRAHGALPHAAQFSQAFHPPLYYLAAQPFFLGDRTFPKIKLLQLFSLLTSVSAFVLLHRLIGKHIFSPRIRIFTALFAALLPQLVMFGNYVSNDSLAIFLGALLLTIASRFLDNPSLMNKVWLGASMGLGLSTKGTFLAFVPFILFFVFVAERRAGRKIRPALAGLLLVAVLGLALGSYKYIDNDRRFGKPFIHNTDPLIQEATGWPWAEGQKNTYAGLSSLLDWNIAKLVRRPMVGEATQHSYFLMLYGSFWYQYIPESNFEGNKTRFGALGGMIYVLAVIPTLVMMLGFAVMAKKLWSAWRSRRLPQAFLHPLLGAGLFLSTLFLVVYIGMRTDVWSCFQSRLTFPALWGLLVLYSQGLEALGRRPRLSAWAYALLSILYVCFILYFLVELLLILGVLGRA